MMIIGDIGGTHLRIAASDTPGIFEEPVVCDTPADLDAAVAAFVQTVQNVAHGRPITSCVIGIAGLLSSDRETLLKSPHLRGWEGKNIAQAFSQALSVPVHFENDAMLGALGEAHYGSGTGASILAYVTVGTGVGGARVIDGHLDRTAVGFEIGHQRLGTNPDAPEWESLVSGSGIEQRYGKPASELDDPAIWNECADHFAYGLYNTILHWSPERVVLGGAAFQLKNSIPLDRARATLRSIATAITEIPDIQLATLGDHSGLYGALVLASTIS